MQEFDTIIIGSGPGGHNLAAALAAGGERVALIERGALGGTCLNCGCIPTKCLAASADALRLCRTAANFGVDCAVAGFDYPRALRRMESVVASLRQGVQTMLRDVTYIEGEARMLPDRVVQVGADALYSATRRVVIATGSGPAPLRVEGAGYAIDSTRALALPELPASAVIIGGGVIGIELATIWSTMGVAVTVVEYCKEILPGFDADVAKRLRSYLSRSGVRILTGAEVHSISSSGSVHYADRKGEGDVQAEIVVAAVGRRPVLPYGLAECGVELTPRGFIAVDAHMATSVPGIYAIGDVNGLSMLAHSATAQATVIATGNPAAFDPAAVPGVVFTHPEVAQVGIVPEGVATKTVKHMFGGVGKALAMGEAEGYAKFVCRESDMAIMQVSIIGPHASDLIAEATILVHEQIPLHEVSARYIHAHPTLSEIFV